MEIWKDIKGYEGHYQVSNLGNVKSLKFNREKILKKLINTDGYFQLGLSIKSVVKIQKIHQLMAIAFLNHTPNKMTLVVDHINNIKTDNRLENLQIVTHRENSSKDSKKIKRTSQYIGVSWVKKDKIWISRIENNRKKITLGRFKDEFEAHLAYQKALNEINNTYK
jgi:hypothetical protein